MALRDRVNLDIITTAGEQFTEADHKALVLLIHKRFGCSDTATYAAWRRLLQNDAEDAVIHDLLFEAMLGP